MKGKRTELSTHDCAIARSLDVIGDWWSLLIIRDARSGKRRFSEFHRNLEMAKNILATRLKALVERGIMQRVPASDGSELVARSVVAASSGADRASPRPGQRRQRSATAK